MTERCPVCGGPHDRLRHFQIPVCQPVIRPDESRGQQPRHNQEPGQELEYKATLECSCSGHNGHHHGPAALDLTGIRLTAPGRAVYRVENMDCPMEEALIRKKLSPLAGVDRLEFNLMKRVLTVHHQLESLEAVEAALNAIDMKPVPLTEGGQEVAGAKAPEREPWPRLIAGALLALGAETVHFIGLADWLSLTLALAAIALGGLSTYKKGWIALKNLNLNMNALMSFAVTGALIIGQWPEAAMVMVLFNVAETLEAKSLARARAAIGEMMNLAPETATVQLDDGAWRDRPADQVEVGARVRVRPGQRVALDGRVVSGGSTLNQAPITGESLPVEKTSGDQIFAGSINESGSFEYTVTAAFENSTLARIIRVVEEAQSSRAPTQRFVDRFARIYTPIVFAGAILLGVLPPLVAGEAWLPWLYKALVLLVIACPCALVISTPVTIVSGLAAAARQGMLIKGGAFLEEGRKLKSLALDKTGTLTSGRPEQTDFVIWPETDTQKARRLAAALAARSDHPVSKALITAALRDGFTDYPEALDFTALPGRGSRGLIDGQTWYLANGKLLEELGWLTPDLAAAINALESEGQSVVAVAAEGKIAALFAVADTLKEGTRKAISEIKSLGLKTVMLTGDNENVARAVAAKSGVDDFKARLMPEDKLTAVAEMQKKGPVGMVGDGINDAPALARADIGLAMAAAGTDTAIETADVALMDDDLAKLPAFIRLSRRAHAILWQNIGVALSIKALFVILTFFGHTTMWMAVFADIGVSLMVVANGLRMLKSPK